MVKRLESTISREKMKKYYIISEQIISTENELKQIEIEAFINRYSLNHKLSSKEPKSKPILEIFILLFIVNTVIGIINWNFTELLQGYAGISILFLLTLMMANITKYNIKEN